VQAFTDPIRIRHATEEDFMDCVNISHAAWPEFRERESIYHLFCKHFSNTSFVALSEGVTRGFLLGFLSQTDAMVAYLHLVAVHPNWQNHGIAKSLYMRFFQTAREQGRRRIRLIVNPDNARSLRFHEALGFRADLTGETVVIDGVTAVSDYNGPGKPMVPFCKDLEPFPPSCLPATKQGGSHE
jgi:ribosomal protein S18 acetylase RimI-like enzyme